MSEELERWRFYLTCGHSTQVLDGVGARQVRAADSIVCWRCERTGTVTREKRLGPNARLPTETRNGRDQQARREAAQLRAATQQRDVAARHWKAP